MFKRQPSSFVYKRAMANKEKGGKTWCVVDTVVKHAEGHVTCRRIASGLATKEDAVNISHSLNCG